MAEVQEVEEAVRGLVLGWEVTATREPRYWLQTGAASGSQSDSDLVCIAAELMAAHTAIIAQSGTGKSFFLGRLVEEILLNTRARCLVLDPNADFRRASEVADATLWTEARYDSATRVGRLPHEKGQEDFKRKWLAVSKRIRAAEAVATAIGATRPAQDAMQPLKLSWTALDVALLAEDVDPQFGSDLFHCHQFVRVLERVGEWRLSTPLVRLHGSGDDLVAEAERLLAASWGKTKGQFRGTLDAQFPSAELAAAIVRTSGGDVPQEAAETIVGLVKEQLASGATYVSEPVARYYFGKVREYQAAGILDTGFGRRSHRDPDPPRLDVLDLPSLEARSARLLATNAVLSTEWNRAREEWTKAMRASPLQDKRVPTFVVVDEAHNLVPANPRGRPETVLRDQIRTIVAEGRKYGLFLVVVSQRPDKLDPMVLSECENIAIMHMNSESLLTTTARLVGIDDLTPNLLQKCLAFEVGRVLLAGRWCPAGPKMLYGAARRTVEGGRNLRREHWAVPPRWPGSRGK